jgi:uncharacterized protein (UPF0264 family)
MEGDPGGRSPAAGSVVILELREMISLIYEQSAGCGGTPYKPGTQS